MSMTQDAVEVNDFDEEFSEDTDGYCLYPTDEDAPLANPACQPPMSKQEARQSIQRAKNAIREAKERMNLVRWELYNQRERRAWAVLGFATFEDFAAKTYKYRKAYAHQLADAARTEQALSAIADYKPLREYPLRRLGTVVEAHRAEVYTTACALSGDNQPTAKEIDEAGRRLGVIPPKKQKNGSNSPSKAPTTIFANPPRLQLQTANAKTRHEPAIFQGAITIDLDSKQVVAYSDDEQVAVSVPFGYLHSSVVAYLTTLDTRQMQRLWNEAEDAKSRIANRPAA